MEVSSEFLAAGARAAGGYTRQQLQLLGLNWPPPKGWKKLVMGLVIPDESAEEFLRLSGSGSRSGKAKDADFLPPNWCGTAEPVDIYLYVLALEGDRFYVGLTTDIDRRFAQHSSAEGAEWTKRHRPVRIAVSAHSAASQLTKAGTENSDGSFMLPFDQHPYHRAHTHSYCVQAILTGDVRLVIPVPELIRFYFGSSSSLLGRLFQGPFQERRLPAILCDARDRG